MATNQKKQKTIAVSELKNRLLEIVRLVEKGAGFRISKGGTVVAALVPAGEDEPPVVGFAKVEICGDILTPPTNANEWTADEHNLK